jgi:transcriptional regulator with XRE-family HTH domain
MTMSPIGQQLRAAYHESGMTYEQLAGLADVSVGVVQRALSGKPINTSSLLRLCEALKRRVRIETASH